MNAAKRRAIFERLRAANPEPRSELEHHSPFELLVAVVLSAQATDKGVNKATARLFPVANSPAAIDALGVEGLIPYISSIGLFNTKAKNVIALSQILLRDHHGEVPRDRAALEALPGVGRKTANVVLNVAFGEPTIAVDTHIFRVANRTGLAPGKDPLAVEHKLDAVVPDEFRLHAHHWLILHGRYTCVARVPKCPVCIINDLCEFKHKTRLADPAQIERLAVARDKRPAKAPARSLGRNKRVIEAQRPAEAERPALAQAARKARPPRVAEPLRPARARKNGRRRGSA
jgi:endonuclease-3